MHVRCHSVIDLDLDSIDKTFVFHDVYLTNILMIALRELLSIYFLPMKITSRNGLGSVASNGRHFFVDDVGFCGSSLWHSSSFFGDKSSSFTVTISFLFFHLHFLQ
jgi:hypothetical protein